MTLTLVPITLRAARAYVDTVHRHHAAPVGGLFAIAASNGQSIVGVVIVGRPVARMLNDGYTAEVTRLATAGYPNACSLLYAAAWRAARAMGYRKLITYTLASEPGTSLRAAGWLPEATVVGRSWSRPSRPRIDLPVEDRVRWSA